MKISLVPLLFFSTCYSLSRFCSKLKHLDLTSCVSITNSSLKGISEGCRSLEYLNLSWCDQITKDGVEALVRGCRGLKALLLRGCTQVPGVDALVYLRLGVGTSSGSWLLPSPGSIPLSFCLSSQLEDEALKHIQNYCHELVSLNLQSCSVSNRPPCVHPHPTFSPPGICCRPHRVAPQEGGTIATP